MECECEKERYQVVDGEVVKSKRVTAVDEAVAVVYQVVDGEVVKSKCAACTAREEHERALEKINLFPPRPDWKLSSK